MIDPDGAMPSARGPSLRHLGAESLVYGLAAILARAAGLILLPVYARVFSREDFGEISIVTATATAAWGVSSFGMELAAHRWYWEDTEEGQRRSTISSWLIFQVCSTGLIGGLLIFSSTRIGPLLTGRANSAALFQVVGVMLPAGVPAAVALGLFRMQRRPWASLVFGLCTSAATVLVSIWLVLFQSMGTEAVFLGQLAGAVAGLALSAITVGPWLSPRNVNWARMRTMMSYALPLVPASIAMLVIGISDRYFIRFIASPSELGTYQVASSLASVVAIGTGAFQQAVGPFVFSIHQQLRARETYAALLSGFLLFGCLAVSFLSLFAPELVRLVATTRYSGASTVIGLLALSNVVVASQFIANIGMNLTKRNAGIARWTTIGAVLHVTLNFVLVPSYGIVGAASASLVAQLVVGVGLLVASQRQLHIAYRLWASAAILVATMLIVSAASSAGDLSGFRLSARLVPLVIFVPLAFLAFPRRSRA